MNANLLKAEFVKNGLTQEQVAKEIGMGRTTFWRHMIKESFPLTAIMAMITLLKIENPERIFFVPSIKETGERK